MSFPVVQALEASLATSDNDKKAATLAALRVDLLSEDVVVEPHTLIPLLKTALKSSNGLLYFAALACLPPLFDHLSPSKSSHTTPNTLRNAVVALITPVMSSLGDSKERVREASREALLAAARAACEGQTTGLNKSSPAGSKEDSLGELERIVKELGFASKTARTREQVCLYLATIRNLFPTTFPIRTYLPSLVTALEDSDPLVRSAALESTITIFSEASVPNSAKSDLKKELAKQSTRKGVADAILLKVLGGGGDGLKRTDSVGSVNGLAKSGTLSNEQPRPISSASGGNAAAAPASEVPLSSSGVLPAEEVPPFYVASTRDLEVEFTKMLPPWEGKESEHNWIGRERNIVSLRGMLKAEVHLRYTVEFVAGLKMVSEGVLKTLASLRTTLAAGSCTLFLELAVMGTAFDPLLDTFLPPLLRMAAQTKRIVAQKSQAAATALIRATSYHVRTLQYFWQGVGEKTVQARTYAVAHLQTFIEVHGNRSKAAIENGEAIITIDKCLRKALADSNPGVRETARLVFWQCTHIWPGMTVGIMSSLDGTAKKQLERANPDKSALPATSPAAAAKRPSVRSLIQARAVSQPAVPKRPSPPSVRSGAKTPSPVPSTRRLPATTSRTTSSPVVSVASAPSKRSLLKTLETPNQRSETKRSLERHSPTSPLSNRGMFGQSDEMVVDDEMKIQALQAESAAQRLLEYADEHHNDTPAPVGPGGALLLDANSGTPGGHTSDHAAPFADSPMAPAPTAKESWWTRQADLATGTSLTLSEPEVRHLAKEIEDGTNENVRAYRTMARVVAVDKLAMLPSEPGVVEKENGSLGKGVAESVFDTLCLRLKTPTAPREILDAQLVLLRALVMHQGSLLTGRETVLFSLLFQLRGSSHKNVGSGAEAIALLVAETGDPLLSMGCIREAYDSVRQGLDPSTMQASAAYTLALKTLGRCLAHLPGEIVQDELLRIRDFIKEALNNTRQPDLRLAAVMCLVDANSVLRDLPWLFTMMSLTTSQEALLSYYCETTA